jgi:hypothetical protein
MATVLSSLPESSTINSEQKLSDARVSAIVLEAFLEIRIAVKPKESRFIQK